jgi:hypothetical protein
MTLCGSSGGVYASAHDTARISAWLIIVLLIPRIARMFYPEIWVEDDFYLESAWMVSVGMRPYLDFVQPHMPRKRGSGSETLSSGVRTQCKPVIRWKPKVHRQKPR